MSKSSPAEVPTVKPEPAEPPRAPESAKASVDEHCRAQFPESGPRGRRRPHPGRWRHAAAAALHCWAQCAYHTSGPMQLSAEDYAKALEAGAKLDTKGIPHPHAPALFAVKGL